MARIPSRSTRFRRGRRLPKKSRRSWTQLDQLGLRIRAGIHTGEVDLRGDDVGGIAVHLGAHVMAEAGPGEILVSATVRDLVAGSGIAFEDRGRYSLKGIEDDWQLLAVSLPA